MSSFWKPGCAPAWGLEKRALMSLQYLHPLFNSTSWAGWKMDAICEEINLRQQLLPLFALLQRLPVKSGRSRKRQRSRRREWTVSAWPALWPGHLGRWRGGAFKPFCSPTQRPWAQERLGLPSSTSSAVPWYGPEGWGGHVLLLLGSSTITLPHTEKGQVLEGFPLFLPPWLEENAQLLKENTGKDAGVRNSLEGLSLVQVSGNPQLYQFTNCEWGKKMSFVVHAPLDSLQSIKCFFNPKKPHHCWQSQLCSCCQGKNGGEDVKWMNGIGNFSEIFWKMIGWNTLHRFSKHLTFPSGWVWWWEGHLEEWQIKQAYKALREF